GRHFVLSLSAFQLFSLSAFGLLPVRPRTIPGLSGSALAHRQTPLTVELEAFEEPPRLLRRERDFLPLFRGTFLLSWLPAKRRVLVILVVTGRTGRHLGRRNASFELL